MKFHCIWLSTENLDLILIPGLAFTKNGKRLGRGKGYYDRFLAKCFRKFKTRPFTLGLAFREQIVSDIPTTDTDVIIDQVLYTDYWTTTQFSPKWLHKWACPVPHTCLYSDYQSYRTWRKWMYTEIPEPQTKSRHHKFIS